MKLGNGVGSVYKLSGNRRNPYIVRKTFGWDINTETGRAKQLYVTIGYAPTRAKGLEMLMEYNKILMILTLPKSPLPRFTKNGQRRNSRQSQTPTSKAIRPLSIAALFCTAEFSRNLN